MTTITKKGATHPRSFENTSAMGFCCVLLLLQVLLPLLFSTWQPPCTRLGLQPVHTKGTLKTAAHQRWRLVSCVRLASQESNDTKMSTCRHFVHRPYPCTRLGTQPAHTKCTLETASHPWQRPVSCASACAQLVDLSILDPHFTVLVSC